MEPESEESNPDPAQVLIDQVLEFGLPALVAGGRHVGDVVGNDLNVGLLGLHAGGGDVERAHVFFRLSYVAG